MAVAHIICGEIRLGGAHRGGAGTVVYVRTIEQVRDAQRWCATRGASRVFTARGVVEDAEVFVANRPHRILWNMNE